MKKEIELLAPAGSLETCKAVILSGADAVYLGGHKFGARAYANNFTTEELIEAIDFAHLHQAKIHLTVNTLCKQRELEALYDYILPFYERGLDAVIVQDLGVFQYLHTCFPDLSLHASTQMSVAGAYGAEYLYQNGAQRIVLARELSLAEIEALHASVPVELEAFIHGALCYCYSGACLMSSMLGGRSGNRGRCAGTCRLPYEVQSGKHHPICDDKKYPLSLKDLCTVQHLSRLADAGIHSFKIEGRMKSTEYAAGVVSVYRKYFDAYLSGLTLPVDSVDLQKLMDTGNRSGFTDGYFFRRNGKEMVSFEKPGHEKNESVLQNCQIHEIETNARRLPLQAKAVFKVGEPSSFTVFYGDMHGYAQGGIVQAAQNRPMERDMIQTQLFKMGNTPFCLEKEKTELIMDPSVFLPKQQLNQLRRDAVADLTKNLLSPAWRKAKQTQTEAKEYLTKHHQIFIEAQQEKKQFPKCYVLVETTEQLEAVTKFSFLSRVYLSSMKYSHPTLCYQLAEDIKKIHASGKEAYFAFPPVFRKDTSDFYEENWDEILACGIDGFLLRSIDEMGFFLNHQKNRNGCVLDYSIYTWSDYTKNQLAFQNFLWDTVPVELNKKELLHRNNQQSELIVYGYQPLMISAQCVHANTGTCDKRPVLHYLKDRYQKTFPVKNICVDCYNVIYNSRPLCLLHLAWELINLETAAFRLQFSIESREQSIQVLEYCQSVLADKKVNMPEFLGNNYTNGHYKRGVE